MKANRSKPRGAVAFGAKLIRLVFWFPSIYSPTYWLLITAVLWWQRGQSRSATGTLPETRRLLLSVTRSIELLLIKCTLIYGFKVTECAFSSQWQVQAVVWWIQRRHNSQWRKKLKTVVRSENRCSAGWLQTMSMNIFSDFTAEVKPLNRDIQRNEVL